MDHTYLTHDELKQELRDRIKSYGTQRAAARAIGVSDAYVSDALTGQRPIGPAFLDWLGYDRVVVYVSRNGKE